MIGLNYHYRWGMASALKLLSSIEMITTFSDMNCDSNLDTQSLFSLNAGSLYLMFAASRYPCLMWNTLVNDFDSTYVHTPSDTPITDFTYSYSFTRVNVYIPWSSKYWLMCDNSWGSLYNGYHPLCGYLVSDVTLDYEISANWGL